MSKYFVIHNSDGDTYVKEMDKDELLYKLNPADPWYGDDAEYLDAIKHSDTNYWGSNLLIIKGEIVMPAVVKVVEKLEIE